MDKFLVSDTGSSVSRKKPLPAGVGQKTLQQCKKTVTLRGHTAMNFQIEHIYACKSILEQQTSTTDDKLEQLRILSVMHVSEEHLHESKVGHVVRRLSKDTDPEISRLARKLLEKWKALILHGRDLSKTAKSTSASSRPVMQSA